MPDLDNHMDDLFRKAADNYRPAAGESDWDKISPLINKRGVEILPQNKKSYIVKKSAPLLLLLFLAATGFILINFINTKSTNAILASNSTPEVKTPLANIQPKSGVQGNIAVVSSSSITNSKTALKITVAGISGEMLTKKNNTSFPRAAKQTVNIWEAVAGEEEATGIYSNEKIILAGNKQQTLNFQGGDTQISLQGTGITSDHNLMAESKKIVVDTNTTAKNTPKKKVDQPSKQKRFYLGFTAGPEFSGVKKFELHPGYEAGIIAGYQLNQTLAVETGILFNKKKYAADGKYFNPEKIDASMPTGMEIVSLSGNCSEFEVPLKLNYNIVNHRNAIVYLSAGFSSYLLINESNRYKTLLNGGIDNMTGSYKNTTFYPAATADISIGFERKLQKGNKLRLEPYLRLPLKGIGIGAMKVTSAGMHASFILFPNK